jgi:hypothetical protein
VVPFIVIKLKMFAYLRVIIECNRKCLSLDGERNINHQGKSELGLPTILGEKETAS